MEANGLFNTNPIEQEAPAAPSTDAFRDRSVAQPSFAIGATQRCRTAVLFDNIGPYHCARLEAVVDACELLAVELGKSSGDYSWPPGESRRFRRVTMNPLGESSELDGAVLRDRLADRFGDSTPTWFFCRAGRAEARSSLCNGAFIIENASL